MRLIKRDSVSPFLFPHTVFCIISFYCTIFYRDYKYFIECFIYISFILCSLWFSKMENGPRKWINDNLLLYFCVPKNWWSHLCNLSSVPWMNYLSNSRLARVTCHWVCEIRKITELPALLFVMSYLPHVNVKRIECQQ